MLSAIRVGLVPFDAVLRPHPSGPPAHPYSWYLASIRQPPRHNSIARSSVELSERRSLHSPLSKLFSCDRSIAPKLFRRRRLVFAPRPIAKFLGFVLEATCVPISRMVANAEVFALYRDESPQFVWNGWLSARRIGGEAVSKAPIENSDENRISAGNFDYGHGTCSPRRLNARRLLAMPASRHFEVSAMTPVQSAGGVRSCWAIRTVEESFTRSVAGTRCRRSKAADQRPATKSSSATS